MQIPDSVIDQLKKQVQFETEADLAQFIADALNSYVALGQLVNSGAVLQAQMQDGAIRRVVLPLQSQSA